MWTWSEIRLSLRGRGIIFPMLDYSCCWTDTNCRWKDSIYPLRCLGSLILWFPQKRLMGSTVRFLKIMNFNPFLCFLLRFSFGLTSISYIFDHTSWKNAFGCEMEDYTHTVLLSEAWITFFPIHDPPIFLHLMTCTSCLWLHDWGHPPLLLYIRTSKYSQFIGLSLPSTHHQRTGKQSWTTKGERYVPMAYIYLHRMYMNTLIFLLFVFRRISHHSYLYLYTYIYLVPYWLR